MSLLLTAALLTMARGAGACEPAQPPPSSRLIVVSSEDGECYEHLLATPALLPSSVVASYFGVGASASYENASYRPFTITGDALQLANISGSLDVGLATDRIENPIVTRAGLSAHFVGEAHSAINAGSFVSQSSRFSGGIDFGFATELFESLHNTPWKLTATVQVSTRQGALLRPLNAIAVIERNPSDLDLLEGIDLITQGLKLVPVDFDENAARAALAYAYMPLAAFSLQGSLGARVVSRELYPKRLPAVTHERETYLPEVGVAAQLDIEALSRYVPLALLGEYRLSQFRATQKVTTPRIQGDRRVLDEEGLSDGRFPKHVVAFGVHYSRKSSANLDAAATFFAALNLDPNREWAVGKTLAIPSGREFGLIAISRYVW